jgi:membrane protein
LLYDPPRGLRSILSIGLLAGLWAASAGTAMTMSAMDRCYDVERVRPFYKQRPLAILLTIILAALILAVIILIPVGTVITNYLTSGTERLLQATNIGQPADENESVEEAATTEPTTAPSISGKIASHPREFTLWLILWQIIRHGLALMFLVWVVALIYHFGPNVKQRFRLLTPGSVFTVALWILLVIVFRVYVDRFGKYGQTYGAVGGVIILLFFFYLYALVLLVGGEINSEIDAALRAMHNEKMKPPPAEVVVDTEPAKETP